MAECYALTQEERLRSPLEQAVAEILRHKHRERDPRFFGGWGYFFADGHVWEGDEWPRSSVTAWQVMALESARLRFRPILMTAFAFILGVVPLMKATGAGAGAQNVMGTAVFWGMLIATALGVFLIPGNFAFVESLGRKGKAKAAEEPVPEDAMPAAAAGEAH